MHRQKRARENSEKEEVAKAPSLAIEAPEPALVPAAAPSPPESLAATEAQAEGAAKAAAREHFGVIRTVHISLPPDLLPLTHWNYPSTDNEAIRALVFEDLWRREYYLTPAAKFGGDYLAYKGDPLKYHAVFVVIVQPWRGNITARELVSIGRLAVTVKKSPVIASVDDRTKRVTYFTVDWQGVT